MTECIRRADGAQTRNIWIDIGRLVAAVAVVWIHAAESESGIRFTLFCRFAVPFFIVATL